MKNKPFKRPCNRCGKSFDKIGKYQKICKDCNQSRNSAKLTLQTKYFKQKEKLDTIRDNATLSNWKILSEAYSIGKKIWGTKFTRVQLASDMEMPISTVLRCLSLDKATKKSIKLMKDGKISTFKLAMICQGKDRTYQDEIVKMVIDNNYSTYQIKSLHVKKLKDINLERLRLATEKGFARKDTAAAGFQNWISRGKLFLLVDKDNIPNNKINEIKKDLLVLNKKIESYIND